MRALPELRATVLQVVVDWQAAEASKASTMLAHHRHTIALLHRQVRSLQGSLGVSERLRERLRSGGR